MKFCEDSFEEGDDDKAVLIAAKRDTQVTFKRIYCHWADIDESVRSGSLSTRTK